MDAMKFRETGILKIVEESIKMLSHPDRIVLSVESSIENEAVWIDHYQMVTLLVDLEKNAVDAMPDGGFLTIRVAGDEKQITLMITDTGKGIPEENRPFLFTPFFTTKPVGDGTGLGLPQAFVTVKAHHGDITIESNTDPSIGPTGTTVKITLPRKQKFQMQEAKVILHEE